MPRSEAIAIALFGAAVVVAAVAWSTIGAADDANIGAGLLAIAGAALFVGGLVALVLGAARRR